jgi:hypothetical protein
MQQEDIKHIEALNDIRSMMRKSSRFLSLSGLSGIFAGVYALAGFFIVNWYINEKLAIEFMRNEGDLITVYLFFAEVAIGVLSLSLITAYIFSARKAKKNNSKLFDHTAWQLMWHMAVPLAAGGLLSIALVLNGAIVFIAPVMLCFYGTAIFAASRMTYDDVKYLGLGEIALGLICAFDLGNGLLYWALGFGVLHIIYGALMWWKYERIKN